MNELKTALYASDDWQVTNRLWLSGGIRLEYYKLGGRNAMAWGNTAGTEIAHPENMRTTGWTLKDATLTPQNHKFFLPAVAFSGRYTIAQGLGILFEGIYTKQSAGSPNFAGSNMPNTDAINTYFGNARTLLEYIMDEIGITVFLHQEDQLPAKRSVHQSQ